MSQSSQPNEAQNQANDSEQRNKDALSVAVLQETIRIKEKQLEEVEDRIARAEELYQSNVRRLKKDLQTLNEQISNANGLLEKVRLDKATASSEFTKLKEQMHITKREIHEARVYKKQQDKLIQEFIEEGNTSLKAINYEIEELQRVKNAMNLEIAQLHTDKSAIEEAITEVHEKFESIEDSYREHARRLRDSLAELKESIEEQSKENKRVIKDTEDRLALLRRREEELVAKRSEFKRERTEFDLEKRRWSSTKSLYDVETEFDLEKRRWSSTKSLYDVE